MGKFDNSMSKHGSESKGETGIPPVRTSEGPKFASKAKKLHAERAICRFNAIM
ncbi:hypothetical protein [Sphingobium sp. BS19]|uniref:hypothetical protein n=1 Tax=Sphingobium sp. BS19 TaxID=3018973 RepID=UPI0024901847|nr:hypothetical protein [Sphingobium sp. BS19]